MLKTSEDSPPVLAYCLGLADDALVLGQRLSEWCSRAPTLEADIAFSNTALDYLGRARLFYAYAQTLCGHDEDQLAYWRDCGEYRNLLIFELPNGDFAQTMARQYFIDAFDTLFFDALAASSDARLAEVAAKAVKEARYHERCSALWLVQLGDGSDESHRRMQNAVAACWDYCSELFHLDEAERRLVDDGVAADRAALLEPWRAKVLARLDEAMLETPAHQRAVSGGREGVHTEHLGHLLAEMQWMQHAYPGLRW